MDDETGTDDGRALEEEGNVENIIIIIIVATVPQWTLD